MFTNDSSILFTNDQPIIYQRLQPIVYQRLRPIVYQRPAYCLPTTPADCLPYVNMAYCLQAITISTTRVCHIIGCLVFLVKLFCFLFLLFNPMNVNEKATDEAYM